MSDKIHYENKKWFRKRGEPCCRRFAGQNDRFSFIFHRFSVWLWRSFRRPPVGRKVKKLRNTAESGRFYAGLPVLGSGERQIQDIRLNKPMVLAVKTAKPKDVDYEKR